MEFNYILNSINAKPQEVIMIGESKTDIIPAKKASINTIYINYNIDPHSIKENEAYLINKADASITEFSDIPRILSKKN